MTMPTRQKCSRNSSRVRGLLQPPQEQCGTRVSQLATNVPDVVFLDLVLPDGKGIELFNDKAALADTEVVLITGARELETSIEALRLGAADYLIKPVSPSQVQGILSASCGQASCRRKFRGYAPSWIAADGLVTCGAVHLR